MTSKLAALAAVVPLLIGCRVERNAETPGTVTATSVQASDASQETFALGTRVSAVGAVDESTSGESFRRGGEIYMSVDVSGASSNQEIKVKWLDDDGRVLRQDARMVHEGSRYSVFSSGATAAWQPGRYRALVVIDGRRVTEKPFAMI